VVLYGRETWSLTLREEHRLKVFENRALRGMFGLKRDEVSGGWRNLHNEELRDLYSSPSVGSPRRNGWTILGWILERWNGMMWTGLVWLRIGTGGELL
jgi:hypothetical protein